MFAGLCWKTLLEIPWCVEASSLILWRDPEAEALAGTFCPWGLTARSEGTWQKVQQEALVPEKMSQAGPTPSAGRWQLAVRQMG